MTQGVTLAVRAQFWAELDGLRARALQTPGHTPIPLPPLGHAVACSDDLELAVGRLGLRVLARDHGHGRWQLDFRDNDPAGPHTEGFALSPERLAVAVWLAVRDVLGPDVLPRALEDAIHTELAPGSWVGATPTDPARAAFAMARAYDVTAAVLARAWPQYARAASCTLGAIVSIVHEHGSLLDVIPGGQGATASSRGRAAVAGPILGTRAPSSSEFVEVAELSRPGSGGVGVWHGGDGATRRYHLHCPVIVHVALDRRTNPPNGGNRGGPPRGSELQTIDVQGNAQVLPPWREHNLPADTTLVVSTAGGGGFGYPQWQAS